MRQTCQSDQFNNCNIQSKSSICFIQSQLRFFIFPLQIIAVANSIKISKRMKSNRLWLIFKVLTILSLFKSVNSATIVVQSGVPANAVPIRLIYIDGISNWGSAAGLAASLGVPGYAPPHLYNYVVLSFWLYQSGPADAALLWANPSTYFGTTSTFGSNDSQIRASLKSIYSSKGIKLMVSAFGSTQTPTSSGFDPVICATQLASFVSTYSLDGVDVDWQDTAAFQSGTGEAWLITFTTTLRKLLPSAIITHAPQAPYFGNGLYPKNAYLAVDKAVGSMIQFYNVQFYNQGSTPYNTASNLFNSSGGWAPKTSVNEIIASGVPSTKIVVGKGATTADAGTGYMTAQALSAAFVAAYQFNKWCTGVMFWQYSSDPNGTILSQSISSLLSLVGSTIITTPTNTTNTTKTNTTTNATQTNTTNTTLTNTTKTNTTNTTGTNTTSTNSSIIVSMPIRLVYIDSISNWGSAAGLAASLAVPGYAPPHLYNYVVLSFWLYPSGPADAALLWANPSNYFGTTSIFGPNDSQIRRNIKDLYKSKGIKLMVSAFGSTQTPTSSGFDPIASATQLASFVTTYSFDGVDVDWQDTAAFQSGTGEAWLITFTTTLRKLLPSAIITHAPQAPYFGNGLYPKNAYLAVDKAVGSMIQFYNIQFYNQGSTPYNTASNLFNSSGGWAPKTSVNEIIASGVPSTKIVVGKGATTADAGTGYMTAQALSAAFVAAYQFNKWCTGVMFWQYSSDPNGTILSQSISSLLSLVGSTIITTPTNTTNTTKTNTTTNATQTNTTNTTLTNTTKTNTTTNPITNTTKSNSTNTTATNVSIPSTNPTTNPFCLTFANGVCTNCAKGYYISSISGTCIPSNQLCQTYNMNSGACITCVIGYALSGVTCISNAFCQTYTSGICTNCYPGYYINSGICIAANQLCATYNMNSGACLSCYSSYKLSGSLCI